MDSTLCHDTRNAGLPLQLSHQYSSGKRYLRRTMSPRGSLRGRPDVTWHVDRRTATRSKCTGLGALTQLGHPTCGNGHPFPSKGPFDGTVRVWVVSGAMHSNPPVSGHGAGYLDLALPIAITPKAEALKDSPFRRPLPDQHTSRDVKQCNHCGIVHGRRLWNRDSVGRENIGYRTFLTKICGKYVPGRFHPEKSVRETRPDQPERRPS